jgi:hypothetical protein
VAARPYSLIWLLFAWLLGVLEPLICAVTTWPGMIFGAGDTRRWDTPRRRRRGLIVVLGGVEGPSLYARAMAVGLLRSGWRGAVKIHQWNAGVPILRALTNLMNREHHRRSADALVQIIRSHRALYGATHVALLAQSGGCWIVTGALEQLGPSEAVDRAVLLAPAISPGYDPARAAAACRDGLASIGGPGDLFFLGLGTSVFGTSDRRFGPSAGLTGWRRSAAGFEEVRWRPEWVRFGYVGNHVSTVSPAFIRRVVAPWLSGARRTLANDPGNPTGVGDPCRLQLDETKSAS